MRNRSDAEKQCINWQHWAREAYIEAEWCLKRRLPKVAISNQTSAAQFSRAARMILFEIIGAEPEE